MHLCGYSFIPKSGNSILVSYDLQSLVMDLVFCSRLSFRFQKPELIICLLYSFSQCEPPRDVEAYIHRSGRTGRAGNKLFVVQTI